MQSKIPRNRRVGIVDHSYIRTTMTESVVGHIIALEARYMNDKAQARPH